VPHRDLVLNEHEARRLADLYQLDILDTPPEERFDRVTRLARAIFKTPVALVSLIDEERQWFKSNQGFDLSETPRDIALCGFAIREEVCLVVPDLSRDQRFHRNPMVTGDPKMRFYAGAVIRSDNGNSLGTLCVIDYVPRNFDDEQKQLLLQMAAIIEHELNDDYRRQEWRKSLFERTLYQEDGLPGEKLFIERCQQTLTQVSNAAMAILGVNEYALSTTELSPNQKDLLDAELARRVTVLFDKATHVATLGHGRYAALYVFDDHENKESIFGWQNRYLVSGALEEVFTEPLAVDDRRVYPTLGVSLFPENGDSVHQLFTKAELARSLKMSHHTRAIGIHDFREEAQLKRSVRIENQLRDAIANDCLRMNYQPKFDLSSGRISGLEALVRWCDDELGEISPADFIPVAENSDIIRDLTDWVLSTACHEYSTWRSQGLADDITVAVNLSADDLLRPSFLQWLRAHLDRTGAPPQALILEVTEGSLINNLELAAEHIREAKSLGLSVHIDDFGTGYSSLSQLHRLPIDALKVDRSFVHEIGQNSTGELVTGAIISLAKSLRLAVIAEGIETEAQLSELRLLGCDSVQGFLLSRPLEAKAVPDFLAGNESIFNQKPG
jgi:EAL domain-containing protein (putative c-di-GMP-specific phosphodiesterase class I)